MKNQRKVGEFFSSGRTALAHVANRPYFLFHIVLGLFGLLSATGMVMVLSASSVQNLPDHGTFYGTFVRHLMFCGLGLVVFFAGLCLPRAVLRRAAPVLLGVAVLALVAVLLPGVGQLRNGARRWIALGPVTLQPVEIAKVALLFWGAHVLTLHRRLLHRWRYAVLPLLPVTALLGLLLVLQPALSSTIGLVVIAAALLFYAGVSLSFLIALGTGGALGTVVLALTADYRHDRVTTYLSGGDHLAGGYQARQALYSLADGGLLGRGLGQSRAKWNYLPNAHNDFIFAIIGEELGLVGAFFILGMFAALAVVGLQVAARTRDPWLQLVVAAGTTHLVVQAVMNIAYVVGLLPVTGVQLPLISSGGTSLLATMFLFGVLAAAARDVATGTTAPGSPAAIPTAGRRVAAHPRALRRRAARLPTGVAEPARATEPGSHPGRS